MDDERFKLNRKDHLFQDVIGRGVLDGYSLKFTRKASNGGRADMMEIGGVVEGKAYRIGQEALKYLLVREGVQNQVYRHAFVDILVGNNVVKDALTFLVIDKAKEEVPPPKNYLNEIRRGGKTVWTVEYEKSFEEELRKLCCVNATEGNSSRTNVYIRPTPNRFPCNKIAIRKRPIQSIAAL